MVKTFRCDIFNVVNINTNISNITKTPLNDNFCIILGLGENF